MIYVIQADNGLVRIGTTSDVEGYVEQLRVLSPSVLDLLGSFDESGFKKKQFYATIAEHKHHGVWYDLDDETLERVLKELSNLNTNKNETKRMSIHELRRLSEIGR